MSKKHFIALADVIREHNRCAVNNGEIPFTPDQLDVLARFCKRQNGNFDWSRWIDYIDGKCGSNGGKIKAA
jgi:hypothetical protein